ncbi:MAG: WG repeat-containing protein, partial [Treponema sp.]|nr:WG repeat-containing protein [Treponema sp.]
MKLIIAMFLGGILFFSCSAPRIYKTGNSAFSDIPLMPFHKNGCFGYINSETFKIVITEQYEKAGNFTGNFAIVENNRKIIINKNNVKILVGFDDAVIFNTEDDKMSFALTKNYGDRRLYEYSGGGAGPTSTTTYHLDPTTVNYRLYNLTAKKLVAEMGKRDHLDIREKEPKIYFFNNYLIWIDNPDSYRSGEDYDEAVYEIQNDGGIAKCAITVKEFISQMAEKYGLQYNEKSYYFHNEYRYEFCESWLGFFNTLDIDKLNAQLPDNLSIKIDEHDWRYKDDKPTMHIYLVDNFTCPLEDKLFFTVKFTEKYAGIYNASENIWAIPPVKTDTFYDFFFTGDKDRVAHGYKGGWVSFFDVYNIKTRKKYINQYAMVGGSIVYMGY